MLKQLKSFLRNEKKDDSIFDIVVYGSSVKGKLNPNDIDLAVIFRRGSLKHRLEKVQSIKKNIQLEKKIDIKGILLEELFKESFFGREGIIFEGISMFDGKPFSAKLGFQGNSLFVYNFKGKTHAEKVKFNYVLSGRNSKGIVEALEGKHLAPGIIQIPAKNSAEFESILSSHDITYSKKDVLIKT